MPSAGSVLHLHLSTYSPIALFSQALGDKVYVGTCLLECSWHQTALPVAYFVGLNMGFKHPSAIFFVLSPYQISNIIGSALKVALFLAILLSIVHSWDVFYEKRKKLSSV